MFSPYLFCCRCEHLCEHIYASFGSAPSVMAAARAWNSEIDVLAVLVLLSMRKLPGLRHVVCPFLGKRRQLGVPDHRPGSDIGPRSIMESNEFLHLVGGKVRSRLSPYGG